MSSSQLPEELKLLEYRVIEVPRVPEIDGWLVPAVLRSRMLATVALAGAAVRPLVVAWVRRAPHGRVEVLAGGGAYLRGDGGSAERMKEIHFPLGAIARALKPGQAARSLAALAHWIRCEARFDPLSVDETPTPGSSLEDFVGLMADRPIGWLVVARPVSRLDAQARLDDLSSAVADLHMHREGEGARRLAFERADQELRYLERWSALGLSGSSTSGSAATRERGRREQRRC